MLKILPGGSRFTKFVGLSLVLAVTLNLALSFFAGCLRPGLKLKVL
jgi:hypothetical protein